MTDVANRSPVIPQSYSRGGITPSKNINQLGRSLNDIECRNGMRIDRNPVGGHIFYPPDDMYHFKLYDQKEYQNSENPAQIKMNWGVWTRSDKYTLVRRVLITDSVTTSGTTTYQSYKTVNLTNNALNWIYIELKPPTNSSILASKDSAQYLSPMNKAWELVTTVETSAPTNYADIRDINIASNTHDDHKNTKTLIGYVNIDSNNKITWLEQCWYGGDIDEITDNFYTGPFKLELVGKGGQTTPRTTPSVSNTLVNVNTDSNSTGIYTNQWFPYGNNSSNVIAINQGTFEIVGTRKEIWPKESTTKPFKVLDLSDSKFENKSVKIGLVHYIRHPGDTGTDADTVPTYQILNTAFDGIQSNNMSIVRSTDSFIYSQWLGQANCVGNQVTDLLQITHDNIVWPKYTNDFAGYYTNSGSTSYQDKIQIAEGWIIGPMNHHQSTKGDGLLTIPDPESEIPTGFPTSNTYSYLVYMDVTLLQATGVINNHELRVASDYRTTNGGHWCDFVQVLDHEKTPIGSLSFQYNTGQDKWYMTDWIQMQYGPIILHHHCTCIEGGSSSDESEGSSDIRHYCGILTRCYERACPETTTSTTTCEAS